jgi:hypothetical protein
MFRLWQNTHGNGNPNRWIFPFAANRLRVGGFMKQNKDTAIRSADIDLGFFDLNYAAEEEIAKIPGIGSQMARAIIQHRPYREIEELLQKVPGMKQENIDELTRAGASVGQPMRDKREFEEAR